MTNDNIMMKKLRTKWLRALRSGKYKQGKGGLRSRGNKFCCLGVLCDVVKPSIWKNKRGEPSATGKYVAGKYVADGYNENVSDLFPPIEILDKVGIKRDDAIFLSELNDDGKSFEEIAVVLGEKFKTSEPISVLFDRLESDNQL